MSRLQTLLAQAEATLPEADQGALADLVASFMAAQAGAALFTPEEMEDLHRLDGEPDDLAPPEEVAAVLAGRA